MQTMSPQTSQKEIPPMTSQERPMTFLQRLIYWGRDRRITTALFIAGGGAIFGGLELRAHHWPVLGLIVFLVGLDVFAFSLYLAFGQRGRQP